MDQLRDFPAARSNLMLDSQRIDDPRASMLLDYSTRQPLNNYYLNIPIEKWEIYNRRYL